MPASIYPTGTTIYDPDKCWNGYTVFSGAGAVLIDMNGNTVNRWKGVGGAPPKLLPGGHVMGSSRAVGGGYEGSRDLMQVDWDGNIVWEFSRYQLVEMPGEEPAWMAWQHHDHQREGNPVGYYVPGMDPLVDRGNTLLLCHKKVSNPVISTKPLLDCTIIEVTWDGKVVWEWLCNEHFDEIASSEEAKYALGLNRRILSPKPDAVYGPYDPGHDEGGDWVHINSISYIGPNKWYDAGDERFHPDNIIWDGCFTHNTAIIDKKTGKLVWQVGPDYTATEALRKLGRIIGQHHAHVIPKGLPGAGNILVFDNGAGIRSYSRVLEFDPITLEVVWQYTPREAGLVFPHNFSNFHSLSISGMQRLPNGNTLICEGDNGRLLEVTPEHETVWEYLAPYTTEIAGGKINWVYRAYRVPYEWVPQVDQPEETAIPPIDINTFRVPGSPPTKAGKVTRVRTPGRT